ncbi:hypothetical protein [Phyllobacterium meliloti]|uniref:hypothetical protein n=1 Tax=Phyllobacterium meliloti TaxID=555317 RepID=UPI001D15CA61|nr:hypothetical protein [Phyllobacterium sp. T1293]UGX84922.1 hypothetical protein LLE53_010455 [Phyllobacterium sp. T1293]
MTLHNEHSSRNLRLRWHISANELQLKALKIAPHSSLRSRQYRQLENERAMLEAELRLQAEIDLWRKYDPDQPREAAGTREGGRWIDGGGAGNSDSTQNGGQNSSKPSASWWGNANRISAPYLRRLPKVGQLFSLIQLLDDRQPAYPLEEALAQYNSAVAVKDRNTIPSLTFRARAFDPDTSPQRVFATMKELEQDEARKVCPKFMTVQTQTDMAAFAAGPRSAYRSAANYGTAVHKILEHQINAMEDPDLKAEESYMKYLGEIAGGAHPNNDVTRGMKGSLRIDVLEKVSPQMACVYDIKTGHARLGLGRIKEISYAVAKNFGPSGFTIIEMRPSQGTVMEDVRP